MKAAIGGFSYSFFDSRQSVEKVRPPPEGPSKSIISKASYKLRSASAYKTGNETA